MLSGIITLEAQVAAQKQLEELCVCYEMNEDNSCVVFFEVITLLSTFLENPPIPLDRFNYNALVNDHTILAHIMMAFRANRPETTALLKRLLDNVPLTQFDWNAEIPFGQTVLYSLCESLRNDNTLVTSEVLANFAKMPNLQWNKKATKGSLKGLTPFYEITYNVNNKKPPAIDALKILVEQDSFHWNIRPEAPEIVDATPLLLILGIACNTQEGYEPALDIMLKAMRKREALNWNAKVTSSNIKNRSALYLFCVVLAYNFKQGIEALEFFDLTNELDFNLKSNCDTPQRGLTPLYYLAEGAAKNEDVFAFFEKVILFYDNLDFNAVPDAHPEATILSLFANNAKALARYNFIMSLYHAKPIIKALSQAPSIGVEVKAVESLDDDDIVMGSSPSKKWVEQVTQIEQLAKEAFAAGNTDIYGVLAQFYQYIGYLNRCQYWVEKIPAAAPNYDTAHFALANALMLNYQDDDSRTIKLKHLKEANAIACKILEPKLRQDMCEQIAFRLNHVGKKSRDGALPKDDNPLADFYKNQGASAIFTGYALQQSNKRLRTTLNVYEGATALLGLKRNPAF